MTAKAPPERAKAIKILRDAGWIDLAIARAFNIHTRTVCGIRKAHGIPPAVTLAPSIDNERALLQYHQGWSDGAIAHEAKVTPTAVGRWRKRRGLPSNFPQYAGKDDALKRRARKMLRQGASRAQVGEALSDGHVEWLRQLRVTMKDSEGVRPPGLSNAMIRNRTLNDKSIMPRIEKAIGSKAPVEVIADAVSDLYLAVLEGRISENMIGKVAPHFRNRAWSMNGSGYGDRSLDAEDENGLRMIDMIADPATLDFD